MVDLQLALGHCYADSKINVSYQELIQATKTITAFGIICMDFSALCPIWSNFNCTGFLEKPSWFAR
jgi:hypothetical protein